MVLSRYNNQGQVQAEHIIYLYTVLASLLNNTGNVSLIHSDNTFIWARFHSSFSIQHPATLTLKPTAQDGHISNCFLEEDHITLTRCAQLALRQ